MSRLGKHYCKYLHLIYTSNVSGPLFHTTRNSILPALGRGDSHTEPEYLQCLRPAAMKISNVPTLAGDPRSLSQRNHGIKPEIAEKWGEISRNYIYKEWSKLSVFY